MNKEATNHTSAIDRHVTSLTAPPPTLITWFLIGWAIENQQKEKKTFLYQSQPASERRSNECDAKVNLSAGHKVDTIRSLSTTKISNFKASVEETMCCKTYYRGIQISL